MSKLTPYFIKKTDSDIYRNCIGKLHELAEGGEVKVSFSLVKETRNQKLNNVMHMWFEDIRAQTGYGKEEIAGRCKLEYFVPVLIESDSAKTDGFKDIWSVVDKAYTYEKKIEILGKSTIQSTSLLSGKEFYEALTRMWVGESAYRLRDPAKQGLEDYQNWWGR